MNKIATSKALSPFLFAIYLFVVDWKEEFRWTE